MSRLTTIFFVLSFASGLCAQTRNPWLMPNFSDRLEFEVSNPSDGALETTVVLPVPEVQKVAPRFPGTLSIALLPEAHIRVLPSQADDLDGDGHPDEYAIPMSLKAHQKTTVDVYYSTTLHDRLPWPTRTFASHSFGYNKATVALESKAIGYRTYGGFFLDVQARAKGEPGLNNSLVGYLSAAESGKSLLGRDILHIGDTLGLGGLYLRSAGAIFRPPLNVPDYAHRPQPVEAPQYRVIATGPVRAVVEATMDRWTIGQDAVRIRAIYSIDADAEVVECRFQITPISVSRTYQVGAGIQQLPKMRNVMEKNLLAVEGEQTRAIGTIGLALYFDPATAAETGTLRTPDGENDTAIFHSRLEAGHAVSGRYWLAAAWQGSGIEDPLEHLRQLKASVGREAGVSNYRHSVTPMPKRLDGEAY